VLLSFSSPIKSREKSYSICFYYVEISRARDAIASPLWGAAEDQNDVQEHSHCISLFQYLCL